MSIYVWEREWLEWGVARNGISRSTWVFRFGASHSKWDCGMVGVGESPLRAEM